MSHSISDTKVSKRKRHLKYYSQSHGGKDVSRALQYNIDDIQTSPQSSHRICTGARCSAMWGMSRKYLLEPPVDRPVEEVRRGTSRSATTTLAGHYRAPSKRLSVVQLCSNRYVLRCESSEHLLRAELPAWEPRTPRRVLNVLRSREAAALRKLDGSELAPLIAGAKMMLRGGKSRLSRG